MIDVHGKEGRGVRCKVERQQVISGKFLLQCNAVEIMKPTLKGCVGCPMNVEEESIVFKAAYVYEA